MKTIRIEEEADLKLKKLAKEFRMSKKSMVNMILENLVAVDVEMFQKRDRGGIPTIVVENNDGSHDEVEFEKEDDDEDEIEWEEEDEEEESYEVETEEDVKKQYFSPAAAKHQRLKLEAIKAGFVTEEEMELYVKRNI